MGIEIKGVLQIVASTQWTSLTHAFQGIAAIERLPMVNSVEDAEGRFGGGIGEFFECISRGLPSWKRLG